MKLALGMEAGFAESLQFPFEGEMKGPVLTGDEHRRAGEAAFRLACADGAGYCRVDRRHVQMELTLKKGGKFCETVARDAAEGCEEGYVGDYTVTGVQKRV